MTVDSDKEMEISGCKIFFNWQKKYVAIRKKEQNMRRELMEEKKIQENRDESKKNEKYKKKAERNMIFASFRAKVNVQILQSSDITFMNISWKMHCGNVGMLQQKKKM